MGNQIFNGGKVASSEVNLCVATMELLGPSETFIRRHLEEISPNPSVLVCFCKEDVAPESETAIVVRRTVLDHLPPFRRKLRMGWNLLTTGSVAPLAAEEKKRLREFLVTHRVNRVLAEYGPTGCLMAECCKELDIPLFVHFHGWDASYSLRKRSVRSHYRALADRSARMIFPSRFLANRLAEIGVPESHLRVVPCGVDVASFAQSQPEEGRVVLAVGRFVEKKAPLLTIRAFGKIARDFPDFTLEMIGDGPLLSSARELVTELQLVDRIVFAGAQNHHYVRERFSKACLFVQHSVTASDGNTEGLPVSILEAMSCGLPVVSTRHSGIPEAVVEGKTGLLVDEGDVDGMAEAMARLLKDKSDRREMGEAARKRVMEGFSSEIQLKLLREIMGI